MYVKKANTALALSLLILFGGTVALGLHQRESVKLEQSPHIGQQDSLLLSVTAGFAEDGFSSHHNKTRETQIPSRIAYVKRGDKYEGLLNPYPTSSRSIELISAVADHDEDGKKFVAEQKTLKIKLLGSPTPEIFLVVREVTPKYKYWLYCYISPKGCRLSADRVFEWATEDVLGQPKLKGMKFEELGVVARLEQDAPSGTEKILPVFFYYSKYPKSVNRYLFTFKIGRDLKKVKFRLKNLKTKTYIDIGESFYELLVGGTLQTIPCDMPPNVPGTYILQANGKDRYTNTGVQQNVIFEHLPDIK